MRIILIVALFFSLSSIGYGQVRRQVPPSAHSDSSQSAAKPSRQGERAEMFKELNLTDEQKKDFREANTGFKSEREAIQANTTLNEADKKTKLSTLRAAHLAKIKTILSPEQFEKFKAMRKEPTSGVKF